MKLGFAVDNLGASERSYFLIKAINEAVELYPDLDVTVFYCSLTQSCIPLNTASMQMTEAYGYDGTIVATNFNTAEKVLLCPAPKRKLYYVYDLEWIRHPLDFSLLSNVYQNSSLSLVTRCEDYKNVLEKLFGSPVLVRDFPKLIYDCQKFSLEQKGERVP